MRALNHFHWGLRFQSLVMFVALSGCVWNSDIGKGSEEKNQTMTTALRLIDQNRSEEAATLLETLYDKYPEDDEVAVALASAYARVAGLQMSSYYDLFRELIFARPLMDLQNSRGIAKYRSLFGKKTSIEADRFETSPRPWQENVMKSLKDGVLVAVRVSEVLEHLPDYSSEKEFFLREALHLLENLYQPKRAHHAYRALLRATIIKKEFQTRFHLEPTEVACSGDLTLIWGDLELLDINLSSLLADLALAFPRERPNLQQAQETLHAAVLKLRQQAGEQGAISSLPGLLRTLSTSDDLLCEGS